MQSVKSCFNRALFRKNFTRFWPIWASYGALWTLLLPLPIINAFRWEAEHAQERPLDMLPLAGLALAAVFGVLCAMAVFSYLYNNRSVAMLHALPLRRLDLFCTNFLSGLSFLLLPNLAVFLLTLLTELLRGTVNLGSLCMWLVVQSLLCLFFYAFAVFCAMFTGHILALPVFYGILNILFCGLVYLFESLACEFVYGFENVRRLDETALLLTPFLNLMTTMRVRYLDGRGAVFYGLHLALLYAFVGLVLTGLAFAVYQKRHLETAGDVVTVPWVKPIFKYGVAFCTAIAFGTFSYRVLGFPEGPGTLLGLLLLWGCAGYFAAAMLLKKSFRVLKESWKGCIAVVVCLIAAVCAMEFDLTGFERRVPDPSRVVSASVRCSTAPYDSAEGTYMTLETPEQLALLARVHEAITRTKDAPTNYRHEDDNGASIQVETTTNVSITYTMDDGTILTRSYDSLPIAAADLSDPDSLTGLLTQLVNLPEVVWDVYFPAHWIMDEARLVDVQVTMLYENDEYVSKVVPAEAVPELWQAIQSDLTAGRLGRRYLMNDRERMDNCYLSDLILSFRVPSHNDQTNSSHTSSMDVRIGLEASATETIKLLESCGLINDASVPVTHAQEQRQNRGRYSEEYYEYQNEVPYAYYDTPATEEIVP